MAAAQAAREVEEAREELAEALAEALEGRVLRQTAELARAEAAAARATAKAEVEAARAATAAQEAEAAALWERGEGGASCGAQGALSGRQTRGGAAADRAGMEAAARIRAGRAGDVRHPRAALGMGEFVNVLTAGDDKVCADCEDLAAEGPYSLFEAMGLLPAHPNCRCAFVPFTESVEEMEE